MKVINLFGGPCTGKSTAAAELYSKLSRSGKRVELVQEFAKDLVWGERHKTFEDQVYIFAKQNHKLESLRGKVDYAITDSPLLLSCIYGAINSPPGFPIDEFNKLIVAVNNTYYNINFFLYRYHEYKEEGRNQTEAEADAISEKLRVYLIENQYNYYPVHEGAAGILQHYSHLFGLPYDSR